MAATAADEQQELKPVGGLTFVDAMELAVVNIDAYVRNKNGEPVSDLTVSDFRVLQDGVEMSISNFADFDETHFRAYTVAQPEQVLEPPPTPVAQPQPDKRPEPEQIFIMLYIDNENLQQFDRNRVLTKVRQFVREVMVSDVVRVMVVSYQRSFTILEPLTTDQTRVLDALRSVRDHVGGRDAYTSNRSDLQRQINKWYEGRAGTRTEEGRYFRDLYDQVQSYAEEEANNLSFTLQAIRQAGAMLSGLKGRKYLVYISNGLPMVPGKDLLYGFAMINQSTSLQSITAPFQRKRLYTALTAAANAQGLTFYTIDATGLDVGARVSAEHTTPLNPETEFIRQENYTRPLQYMADRTGGLAIIGTNNFTDGLQKIKSDLFTYYSLGYTINSAGGDKVHNIEVSLPDHPEYEVRYRRSYVEKSIESQVQDEVSSGLIHNIDHNPMQLEVTTGSPSPASKNRWNLPLEVHIPVSSVALLPIDERYVGNLVLFVAVRDEDGKQSDMQRLPQEVQLPKQEYGSTQLQHFSIDLKLLMAPGQYRIVVGVLDHLTRQVSYITTSDTLAKP